MSPSSPVIEITDLHKHFGHTHALNGLTVRVDAGQVHGFLGPNGAGKSTTIRILLGLLRPDGGSAKLFGSDAWQQATELHRRLAYVPANVQLWSNLSGGEAIDLLGHLRGNFDRARRDELVRRFKLDTTKKCGAYSTGNKQKVAIIAALASNVELYIMDEPTSGLDPLMQAVFNDYIHDLKTQGKTIFLSSHILDEVQALCDHITIIKDGQAIESRSLDELRSLTRLTIAVETTQPPTGLDTFAGVSDLTYEAQQAQFTVAQEDLNAVMKHLTTLGIRSLTSAPPTLESLFLRLYDDPQEQSAP